MEFFLKAVITMITFAKIFAFSLIRRKRKIPPKCKVGQEKKPSKVEYQLKSEILLDM